MHIMSNILLAKAVFKIIHMKGREGWRIWLLPGEAEMQKTQHLIAYFTEGNNLEYNLDKMLILWVFLKFIITNMVM